jgi:hypothetical protein
MRSGITPARSVRPTRAAGGRGSSSEALSCAGATMKLKKPKRKMVVTLRQPVKTVRKVPQW